MSITMSANLKAALYNLSNDVADALCEGGDDPVIVAEGCISCLGVYAKDHDDYAQAEAELGQLCVEHGYQKVLAEAAKHVGTL